MATVGDQLAGIPALTSEGATAYQYKTTGSIASGGLTISKRNGHRRTLVDIFFTPETSGIFLDIQVGDRLTIRLPTVLGDFTSLSAANDGIGVVRNEIIKPEGRGLLWYLSQIIPFDFPTAAQDEDIIITPVVPLGYGALPAAYTIAAIYKDQDTGDVISKVVAGGSANPRRLFTNIITNTAIQAASGQTPLDKIISPSGITMWKDADFHPQGFKTTVYIMMYDASALGTTTGANANGRPTKLHILDDNIELFTVEDQAGIQVDRNLANQLASDFGLENFFIPDNPYVFLSMHKFRFLLDTVQLAGTGVNFAANTQAFIMIGIREPLT